MKTVDVDVGVDVEGEMGSSVRGERLWCRGE